MRRVLVATILTLSTCAVAIGDIVTLTSGRQIQGVVLTNNAEEVRIRTDVGTMGFDASKVANVEITREAKATGRLAPWDLCLKAMVKERWGATAQQIPATVVDKGSLQYVPYISHRAGAYEMNVYGDPEKPACVEIGIYDPLLKDKLAKENCKRFIKDVLSNAGDKAAIDKLNLDKDSVERDGYTIEVTPPTAEDAYGGWWISVYSEKSLEQSRASAAELAAITAPRKSVTPAHGPSTGATPEGDWNEKELAQARPASTSVPTTQPDHTSYVPVSTGRVYVRSYTRKDGTYVHGYTRRR